jgi:predicted  nucleic acid-binding Zn-ribbon protein
VPPPWDVAEAVIAGVEFQRTRAKGFDLSIGCPECGAPQFHFCRSETAKNERLYISHAARRLAGRKLHELRRQRGLVEPRYWRG